MFPSNSVNAHSKFFLAVQASKYVRTYVHVLYCLGLRVWTGGN